MILITNEFTITFGLDERKALDNFLDTCRKNKWDFTEMATDCNGYTYIARSKTYIIDSKKIDVVDSVERSLNEGVKNDN